MTKKPAEIGSFRRPDESSSGPITFGAPSKGESKVPKPPIAPEDMPPMPKGFDLEGPPPVPDAPPSTAESPQMKESPVSEGQQAFLHFVEESPPGMQPGAEKKELSEETALEKDIKDLEESKELTYEEKLAKLDLTLPEAMAIVSQVFEKGFFEKRYALTTKHYAIFRTRSEDDQVRALERIEADSPTYPATVTDIVSRYNMSSSLVELNGVNFRDQEFNDRYKLVCQMPSVFLRLLIRKLYAFDMMLEVVLDEGAIANF